MTTILRILVSPRPRSFSRRIAFEVTARIATWHPGAQIIERDFAVDPPPHPGLDLYEAILSPTPDDDPRFALSEQMIGELETADFVVIGTPMNNFTVPSTLKAWIDHIVRIRRTFRSSPEGKIGTRSWVGTSFVLPQGGYRRRETQGAASQSKSACFEWKRKAGESERTARDFGSVRP